MPTHDEIKKAVLEAAGNPEAGIVKDLADVIAAKIVGLFSTPSVISPTKEARVTKPAEIR
jgi:hypothetical protein